MPTRKSKDGQISESDAPDPPKSREVVAGKKPVLTIAPASDLETPEGRVAFVNALLGRGTPDPESDPPPEASEPPNRPPRK